MEKSTYTFYKIPKIAVSITVSLMLAFMPFTVNLNNYRISLERNEAHAIAPVFVGALAFLEEAAAAAGFATVGEFVATGAGVTAVASGLTIGTAAGIQLGDNAGNNLDALIDAADYPSWDTLSSSEQEAWVSSDNYNAAKYNSLMAGFGLGDDYERYKSTWGSFTPGEFQFSSSANTKLEQLGQIGQNWIDGAGNTIGSILGAFNRQQVINAVQEYVGRASYTEFDGSNVENWPSTVPNNIFVNRSNVDILKRGSSTFTIQTSNEVYMVEFFTGKSSLETADTTTCFCFSKSPFTFGVSPNANPPSTMSQCESRDYNGVTYYYAEPGTSRAVSKNLNNSGWIKNISYFEPCIPIILFGDLNYGDATQMQGYPEEEIEGNEANNIEIYFPEPGITDTTDWDDLLTHTENIDSDLDDVIALLQHIDNDLHNLNIPGAPDLQPVINYLQHIDSDLHQFSFYNDGQLKVHDQGVWQALKDIWDLLAEIADNIGGWNDAPDAPDLIGDFDFDEFENKVPDLLETISELAPFGSILLLSEMYSIMANFTVIEHPQMVFPFEFGGLDGTRELVLDLSWMDAIKPLINFFCIGMLIIAIANATIRIVEIEAAS